MIAFEHVCFIYQKQCVLLCFFTVGFCRPWMEHTSEPEMGACDSTDDNDYNDDDNGMYGIRRKATAIANTSIELLRNTCVHT